MYFEFYCIVLNKNTSGMKKYVLIVLMCLPLWGMSQSTVEWTVFGKAGVDIRSQMISFGGTALEWHPKDGKLGLNYSLRFGLKVAKV